MLTRIDKKLSIPHMTKFKLSERFYGKKEAQKTRPTSRA